MVADLVLTVLQDARAGLGTMAGLAVTDQLIVATGDALLASSNGRDFEPRRVRSGLRGVLAAGDALWVCGDGGQLAVSRDRGATFAEIATGTRASLTALATAADGAVWVVGEGGFAARVVGDELHRVDLGTTARLTAVVAVKDDVVVLGGDGAIRRWHRGDVTTIPTGAAGAVTAMIVTRQSWIVIGDGGFVARSPDGTWFSRVRTDFAIDLEAIASLPDGRLIAVGDRGQILVSADDGRAWRPMASALTAHLWSVERYGGGALIGGDNGLIVQLAPAGEDPRRTVAASAAPAIAREPSLVEALDSQPRTRWTDLAWKALTDGPGHRALLARLAQEPELAAQIAVLDELRDLDDAARAIAVSRLAAELAPELEVILAGALVRGDDLAGVLARPEGDGGDGDGGSPGWEAIDRALDAVYHGAEPTAHFGTVLPYMLGGNDPLHGISAYARTEPLHWHFVTYGFTDLFHKETDDPDESGFGFELTFRLARAPTDEAPPTWALNFLQNLGRYVFGTGNRFAAGHKMGLNGPIALGEETAITAVCFADDPELGESIASPFGKARFVQIVGITEDEYRLIQEWSTTRLVDMLRKQSAMLITSLRRPSLLADPVTAAEVHQLVDAEGSSEDLAFAGDMAVAIDSDAVRIVLGALYAAALPRAMRGRLRHGRSYELRGRDVSLTIAPGAASRVVSADDSDVDVELAPELVAEIERQLRAGFAGVYGFDAWPRLTIEVTPSFIRDQQNRAVEVKGIGDPAAAQEMIDAENARIVEQGGSDDDDDEGDEDDDEEDDDEDGDDDDRPTDPTRVQAALAMTERALVLAPDDDDTQFTHAMLLLDADRANLPGRIDGLLALLPTFAVGVRINVATRMGKAQHARFADAVDVALGEALPERIVAERSSASMASFGDVADELFAELGEAVLAYAPDRMPRLISLLPDDVELLSQLAYRAIEAKQGDSAIALYDRLLALPIPDDGDARQSYLQALNNACIQAHASKAYAAAVRIADRAQPVAHENPYIFHSAACAYVAVGDLARALRQVELAVEHDYDHLGKLEVDTDLGDLRDWPRFKALFRAWRARSEGN